LGDELKNQGSWFGKGDVWKSKISHRVDEPMGWVAHRDQVGSKVFKRRFLKSNEKVTQTLGVAPKVTQKGLVVRKR
jgi:hypothetical protein